MQYYQLVSFQLSFHKSSTSNFSMAVSTPVPRAPVTCIVEESKRRAAIRAVDDHFEESFTYIGIGSGSTIVYVVEAIAAKGRNVTNRMIFVPT